MPTKKQTKKTPLATIASIEDLSFKKNLGRIPAAQKLLFKSLQEYKVNPNPIATEELQSRLINSNIKPTLPLKDILVSVNKINPGSPLPVTKMPEDLQKSLRILKPDTKRFHGLKIPLTWFPFPSIFSPCADRFGYMSTAAVRAASKLPFNLTNHGLLGQLGNMMGDPGRDTLPDSTIPAGFTYFGQFVDHDITFDVSSSLEAPTDANIIHNMRTPALDLDSLYGRGPALDPFLYVFHTSDPATAIKFQLGANTNVGPGGPGGAGGAGGMQVQTDFDVPRMNHPFSPASSTHTAIIGDPRNDENLIVSQFHQTMLRFHNKVVDLLILAAFSGDIFAEAKKIVTHHYQWAVVNDFLKRICGATAVNSA
jgi:hypothetical protein